MVKTDKVTPLVSVGMPCYNRPEMLKRAVECILNQTYKNLEVIISNDASPNPEIYKMLDEYADKDKRIRLWHQPVDLNVYGNYNFVLQQATGKYFMYAQDDDMWEPEFIELLVSELEKYPDCAFALSGSQYITPDGKPWQQFKFNNQNVFAFIFGEKIPFIWMGLWRTDKIKLFDQDPYEVHGKDIVIASEALLAFPFAYVDKLMYSKTIYHEKARDYVKKKPWCHFEMYGTMIARIAKSKYVKHKSILIVLVPIAFLAIVRLYAAQILFLLPLNHPIRKCVRSLLNKTA